MLDEKTIRLRTLAAVLEPISASVSFSPEAHEAFHALGYGPSTGVIVTDDEWTINHWGPCMMPDYTAYVSSRGAHLGNPKGEVVAAVFGNFQPAMVISMWNEGRKIASPEAIEAARDGGAVAQLERILGASPTGIEKVISLLDVAARDLSPAGRPMFVGLMAMDPPPQPLGQVWRRAERLREFRGDAFVAAWTTAGLGGCQIQLLTEILAGFPPRSYTSARGWTPEEMDDAERELTAMGFVSEGKATEAGRRIREEIEVDTDASCMPMVDALGDDVIGLIGTLHEWGKAIIAAGGHAPGTPHQQIMDPSIQDWMDAHGFSRFPLGPK
jgi:hypothetical protein